MLAREYPHCGVSGVPFMNSTTGADATAFSIAERTLAVRKRRWGRRGWRRGRRGEVWGRGRRRGVREWVEVVERGRRRMERRGREGRRRDWRGGLSARFL